MLRISALTRSAGTRMPSLLVRFEQHLLVDQLFENLVLHLGPLKYDTST